MNDWLRDLGVLFVLALVMVIGAVWGVYIYVVVQPTSEQVLTVVGLFTLLYILVVSYKAASDV